MSQTSNGFTKWVLGASASLLVLAIPALVILYGNQRADAQDIAATKLAAEMCCVRSHQNELDINRVIARWEAFETAYGDYQRQAKEERKEIARLLRDLKSHRGAP